MMTIVIPSGLVYVVIGLFLVFGWVSTMKGGIDDPNEKNLTGGVLLALAVILAFFAGSSHAADFPAPARVVDQPHVLSSSAQSTIALMSHSHEQATGNQVVLVIVNDLSGLAVEEYAHQLAVSWGIGQKGKNNGVLFLIAMKERKIRIEVGYGLEGQLPDAKARRIISNIAPMLKAQQWDAACIQGVGDIIGAIRK